MPNSSSKKNPYHFNFRLPAKLGDQVNEFIEDSRITPTQFFTESAIEKLGGGPSGEILTEILNQQKQIQRLSQDLADAARVILILVGSQAKMPKEEVEKWVREKLAGGK